MANEALVLAIDQGTTSSRVLVFDAASGACVASANRVVKKSKPHDGWVEQNAEELYSSVEDCLLEIRPKIVSLSSIKAVGITNQRETSIVWDRTTGLPLCNAIGWQDERTASMVTDLQQNSELLSSIKELCGLPLNPYFSATKLKWLTENCEEVKRSIAADTCMFGTVDSWLIWRLTGGVLNGSETAFVTDVTNASRTMFMNINTCEWSQELKEHFGIPSTVQFPEIRSSSEVYGYIHSSVANGQFEGLPIAGCLGDQQAALVGHGCFSPHTCKSTFGTGCFMLYNTGLERRTSQHGLLTTIAYKFGKEDVHYALEGAVAVAGDVVSWLRDNMGMISTDDEIEPLARKACDEDFNVVFVPAFSGLKAPYWQADARGIILGLTYNTTREHICRAALESTCFQTKEVLDAMIKDAASDKDIGMLRVDGGMTKNLFLVKNLADILHVDIARPSLTEITALGAAYAAGKAVGIEVTLDGAMSITQASEDSLVGKAEYYGKWKEAVRRCQNWHGCTFDV